jgi:hypothetical protein
MMKSKFTIAVDLDGVIFDFEREFCDRFGTENRHIFNLTNRYPNLDPDLILEMIKSPRTYTDLLPIFGGITFVNRAKNRGLGIIFITSRPEGAKAITNHALKLYSLDNNPVVFTSGKDKFDAIVHWGKTHPEEIPIKVMVDDNPDVINHLPDGVNGLYWYQPWNEGNYPTARYDSENMELEVKTREESEWTKFWRV